MTKEFELSDNQKEAAEKVKIWFEDKDGHEDHPIFRLFGYAGTGKTTITNRIIKNLKLTMGEDVLFAAYTGKAAMVMQRNLLPASTIHAMIYQVADPDEKKLKSLQDQLKNPYLTDSEKGRVRQELREESRPRFQLKTKSGSNLKGVRLLVLDECSMVNADMLYDLLTFEIPMLVLGDPGQLPPIEGCSPLTDVKPDVMLTEIHRQAAENPIIWLSTQARLGNRLEHGVYGSSKIIHRYELTRNKMLAFDQIITGKNITRRQINTRMRELLEVDDTPYPKIGEKLICLKNNPENGLFNGMICFVENIGKFDRLSFELSIRKETDRKDTPPTTVRALRAHFDMYKDENALDKVQWREKMELQEFDFAYAITVHKAQGSQWDNVCIIDDGMFDGWGKTDDRRRWLYTGISRAAETVTIAT
jgi:exodeoxyribonuclease-5